METTLEFVSLREVAQRLGLQTSMIYAWIRIGCLPAFRLPSGYLRIPEADLQASLMPERPKKRENGCNYGH
ncbi:helix-turn-helix domain-containing protein [Chloroflexota bacterium]